jgi:hypothetical protein
VRAEVMASGLELIETVFLAQTMPGRKGQSSIRESLHYEVDESHVHHTRCDYELGPTQVS